MLSVSFLFHKSGGANCISVNWGWISMDHFTLSNQASNLMRESIRSSSEIWVWIKVPTSFWKLDLRDWSTFPFPNSMSLDSSSLPHLESIRVRPTNLEIESWEKETLLQFLQILIATMESKLKELQEDSKSALEERKEFTFPDWLHNQSVTMKNEINDADSIPQNVRD